jgi:hypothetical protein
MTQCSKTFKIPLLVSYLISQILWRHYTEIYAVLFYLKLPDFEDPLGNFFPTNSYQGITLPVISLSTTDLFLIPKTKLEL